MSYTPNTWQIGDTITAEKLNHLEGGVEAASPAEPLVITIRQNLMTGDTGDKTAQEVYTALQNNATIIFVWENNKFYVTGTQIYHGREPADPFYQQIYAIILPRNGAMQRACVSYEIESNSNREPVNPTAAVDFSFIIFEGLQPTV